MRRQRNAATAAAIMLLLAACSTVPVQHVQGYSQAFDEASAAGNRLYDGISAKVIQEQAIADAQAAQVADQQAASEHPGHHARGRACGRRGLSHATAVRSEPYPACFDPARFAPGRLAGEPDSLLVRRRALATITTFNSVALRLASGETAEQLGAEVRQLGSNASSLATLSGLGAMGCAADRLYQRSGSAACDVGRDAARRSGASRGARGRQPLDRAAPCRAHQRHFDHVRAQARGGCRTGGRANRPGEGDRVRHRRHHAGRSCARRAPGSPSWRSATCATTTRASAIGLAFQSLAALAGPGGQPFTGQTLDQIDDKVAQLESFAEQYQEQVGR